MTTITLQIREPVGLPTRHRAWSPTDVLGEALGALAIVFRGLTTVAIWALVLLPVYGAPILLLWLLRNRLRALLGPSRSAPA
jgi:hypothetical protein